MTKFKQSLVFLILIQLACYAQDKKGPTKILLSDQGGDRATAYTMSNKIIQTDEGVLCTWIDVNRQNRWALVDIEKSQIIREGKIGRVKDDNHCGVALARTTDGTIHAVVGAHHTALNHYRLSDVAEGDWEFVDSIQAEATYPSLVAGIDNELFLAFRNQNRGFWTLNFARYENQKWSSPIQLIEASKPGYVYWTNSLTVDKQGNLHLLTANVHPIAQDTLSTSLYHGASHVFLKDDGRGWQTDARMIDSLPVKVDRLPLVEGNYEDDRFATPGLLQQFSAPGPRSKEYFQIQLSNLVIDQRGKPCFLYHNGMNGTISLMTREKTWKAKDLMPFIRKNYTGYRVHVQSSVAAFGDEIYCAIMLEPTKDNEWGANGTFTTVLKISPKGDIAEVFRTGSDPNGANWLPGLSGDGAVPLLIYTEGVNAGGFDNNQNDLASNTWLVKL